MKSAAIDKGWLDRLFNTSILQKSRMAWVDYLRGIAIVLVVYRHVLIGLERSGLYIPDVLVTANMIFYSFRMPLFFILSGLFINNSIRKRSFNELVFIKFENLLYPYLIWAFIQLSLQIGLADVANSDRSFIDYTLILYQPRGLDQFWYLPALFNATIIYLFLKVKCKLPNYLQLAIGLVFYFTSHYFSKVSMLSDWMEFYIFFALGDAISILFFKESTQRLLKNLFTFLLAIPVFVITQMYYLDHSVISQAEFLIIALIGCFSMFVLAYRMQQWNIFKFLRVLGFHSLFIYVMHVIVAAFTRAVLVKLFGIHNAPLLLALGIVSGVIVPVIAYNLLMKPDKPLWFLFALKKKDVNRQAAVAQ